MTSTEWSLSRRFVRLPCSRIVLLGLVLLFGVRVSGKATTLPSPPLPPSPYVLPPATTPSPPPLPPHPIPLPPLQRMFRRRVQDTGDGSDADGSNTDGSSSSAAATGSSANGGEFDDGGRTGTPWPPAAPGIYLQGGPHIPSNCGPCSCYLDSLPEPFTSLGVALYLVTSASSLEAGCYNISSDAQGRTALLYARPCERDCTNGYCQQQSWSADFYHPTFTYVAQSCYIWLGGAEGTSSFGDAPTYVGERCSCLRPPGLPPGPSPPPRPPAVESVSITGIACSLGTQGAAMNAIYEMRGRTADGRVFYHRNDLSERDADNGWLYYDSAYSNCNASNPYAGWFIGRRPDPQATSNLVEGCHVHLWLPNYTFVVPYGPVSANWVRCGTDRRDEDSPVGSLQPRGITLHHPEYKVCQNTCRHVKDGRCDDGGPGSEYSFCEVGSDCTGDLLPPCHSHLPLSQCQYLD